ncbi:MAG: glycosyltransferase family 2 protein [Scrofimicrobium sp.]
MDSLVSAVVVTFNPDPVELMRLLAALRPQVDSAIIVDNGSGNQVEVHDLAKEHDATFIGCDQNIGIAAAQNLGIEQARQAGAKYVLLSDQDSVPAPDMVQQLLACFSDPPLPESPGPLKLLPAASDEVMRQFPSTAVDGPLAAVGPVPSDGRGDGTGGDLVYSFSKWRAVRERTPAPGEVLPVPFVLASGCLIPMTVLDDVGPMNEGLFIDHVDLAWCLRAIQKGYRILVSGDAHIYHSLGDEVAHVPGRKRAVHLHSPIRNYYMMRNTLLLQRAPFLPKRWKQRYLFWMLKYMGYYTLAPGRGERIPMMMKALKDGLRGATGPISS